MGVGKTTFVKAFAKILESRDQVSSPTFSIVNEYALPHGKLFHFDLYRIKDEEEALQFGIEDYLSSSHWIIIEWPEKIPNLLPNDATWIKLILNNDHSRTIILSDKQKLNQKNMAKNCNN